MQNNKKHARSVLTMALTLAMTATLAIPAVAAENETYTVSIMPNANTMIPTSENDALAGRFNAFEVFDGDLEEKYDSDKLSNKLTGTVEWGTGVDNSKYGELLFALTKLDKTMEDLGIDDLTELANNSGYTLESSTTLGDVFKQAFENNGYTIDTTKVEVGSEQNYNDAAKTVTVVMSNLNSVAADGNNAMLANEFAKVLATKNANPTDGDDYTYLNETAMKESSWVEENDPTPAHWEITLDTAGYYLIVDTFDPNGETEALSEYMLSVFGNQVMQIKSDIPTVDKIIKNTTTANGTDSETDQDKAASAGIGDIVTFTLTGTLPENLMNYPSYKYIFHDTLSEGLAYRKDSVEVYAVSPEGGKYLLSEDDYKVKTDQTHDTVKDSLDIAFDDLKQVTSGTIDGETAEFKLTSEWKIVVEYAASVTKAAALVDPSEDGVWTNDNRNKNAVYLEFSNNIYSDGSGSTGSTLDDSTGKTPESTVYVYVFGLEMHKIDGVSNSALAGAEFALMADVTTGEGANAQTATNYAVFTRTESQTGDGTDYEYVIDRWITDEDLAVIADTIENWKWGAEIVVGDDFTLDWEKGTYYLSVTTVGEGDSLRIKGLDEGTYTLSEVRTPAVYETMDDVTFTIVPTISEEAPEGALTALKVNPEDATRTDAMFEDDMAYIEVTLVNMPSGYLPGTGGIGTVLFYTGGVIMLTLGGFHIYRRKQLKASF